MDSLRGFSIAAYDHLGGLIAINIIWAILAIPWLAASALAVSYGSALQGEWASRGGLLVFILAAEFVWFAPPTAMLFLAAERWLDGVSAPPALLLRRLPRHAWRIQGTGLLVMAATGVLVTNIFFYQQVAGWIGAILCGIMGWLLVGLGMVSLLLPSVLLQYRSAPIRRVCCRSLALFVSNPAGAFGLFLSVGFLFAVGIITGIGLLCGLTAAIALMESAWMRRMPAAGRNARSGDLESAGEAVGS